jgi:hypothetical protein
MRAMAGPFDRFRRGPKPAAAEALPDVHLLQHVLPARGRPGRTAVHRPAPGPPLPVATTITRAELAAAKAREAGDGGERAPPPGDPFAPPA